MTLLRSYSVRDTQGVTVTSHLTVIGSFKFFWVLPPAPVTLGSLRDGRLPLSRLQLPGSLMHRQNLQHQGERGDGRLEWAEG